MLFDVDEDYGIAEKIVDRIINLKCENGLPILPSTKNVKNQKCYSKACNMLWEIYDGTFLKRHNFIERSDYNMVGWKERVAECEDDWGKVRLLVLRSVKNFYKILSPDYAPSNKKYLMNIKFSNFFETGLNQSMFVNCINEPLECSDFLKNRKIKTIKESIPEKYIDIADRFYKKHIINSKYDIVYWEGIRDIVFWWNLFRNYTQFSFDVKGNFKDRNIISDYCSYILDYMNRSNRECNPYWFRIYDGTDNYICDGFFRSYLDTDRFIVAKNLPRKLWTYGNKSKFETLIVKEKSKIKVNDDNSFIDNLED